MTENQAQQFLQFLKSLPETRAITFRGYVDATITEGRPIVIPTLGATSHSVAIATNNLEKPEVAIFVGTSGRDLTPILEGAPNYNLQETNLRRIPARTMVLGEEADLDNDALR